MGLTVYFLAGTQRPPSSLLLFLQGILLGGQVSYIIDLREGYGSMVLVCGEGVCWGGHAPYKKKKKKKKQNRFKLNTRYKITSVN